VGLLSVSRTSLGGAGKGGSEADFWTPGNWYPVKFTSEEFEIRTLSVSRTSLGGAEKGGSETGFLKAGN
jgi:hypothetical protein